MNDTKETPQTKPPTAAPSSPARERERGAAPEPADAPRVTALDEYPAYTPEQIATPPSGEPPVMEVEPVDPLEKERWLHERNERERERREREQRERDERQRQMGASGGKPYSTR